MTGRPPGRSMSETARPCTKHAPMPSNSAPLQRRQAYGLLLLLVLIWGANWPAMKVGLTHVGPLWFACARYWLGAACLFGYLAVTRQLALPTRADWPIIVSVGILQMALFQPLVNLGL